MIQASNNPFDCSPVIFSAGNSIVSLGTITRVGNVFTFSVGFVWKINGTTYQNTSPIVLTITEAADGYFRIDNALLNNSNSIELQQGLPSETIALRPTYPETNILLTSWNISGDTIGDEESPIPGTDVVKKSFANMFEFNGTGANAIITLNPNGYSEIRLINSGLTSVSGVDLSLMTGPNFESPYSGKPFIIWNNSDVNVLLKHADFENADYPFFLSNGIDVELPPNKATLFHYDAGGLFEISFKNWCEILDVIGLQSVLDLKADLVGGKIPTEQLPSYVDDVLEFTNLAAFPATGETSKIYVALTTNFTYRWTGSVYVKISDTGKLDKVTTVDVEKVYVKNADGTQGMKSVSDFVMKKAIVTNASVTGTFNLDASLTDTYRLTLTGNATFAFINFSSTYAEPMTAIVTGNFAITYPVGTKVIGSYTGGSDTFQFVIEKVDGVTYVTVNKYV